MINSSQLLRGQMEDEEIIKFTRKHWVVIMPDLIPFVFYLTVIGVFIANINNFNLPSLDQSFFQLIVVLALFITAFAIHRFFLRMLTYFMSVTIITNYRIIEIKKTLFAQDSKEALDLRKIQDIQLEQHGLVKNILKFGNLLISLGNSESKTIFLVPNADYFFRLINRLKNEVIVKKYDDVLNRNQRAINTGYDNCFPYLIQTDSHTDPHSINSKE